jgi:hypothetical protein
MPTSPPRWYVPGSLGVNTAFDEPTDLATPLSIPWTTVGSAVRHEGADTLNLLDGGPAALNSGPGLNWWALNANTPPQAVRLASLSARFASAPDNNSSAYVSLSTKTAGGDLVEALRVTAQQALVVPNSLSVGPLYGGRATGRVEVSGPNGEFAFLKRSLQAWPTAPAPGDRFLWYNPDGSARLWTDAAGDLLTVFNNGNVGIGTTNPAMRLHVDRGIIANVVSIGDNPAAISPPYPWAFETVGVTLPTANLRLQSPNSVIVHTAGEARLTVHHGGVMIPQQLRVGELFLQFPRTSIAGFDGGGRYGGGYHWVQTDGDGNEMWFAFGQAWADDPTVPRRVEFAVPVWLPSFHETSDLRRKRDIREIGDVLSKLTSVRSVSYTRIDNRLGLGNHRAIGVIAQEVEQPFPELVSGDGETHDKAVSYSGLVGVLLQGIKELDAKNAALERRVATMELGRPAHRGGYSS